MPAAHPPLPCHRRLIIDASHRGGGGAGPL